MQLILNSDTRPIPFFMNQTGSTAPLLLATPTVTVSKNGGAFVSPMGTVNEIGKGWYALTPTSADTSTNGKFILNATASGADPSDTPGQVVAFNPYDATHLGLSAIPGAAPGAAGGLVIAGNNAAVTFTALTSTGAFTVNGVSNVSQTGDSFMRVGVNGAGLTAVALASALPANFSSLAIDTGGAVAANNLGALLDVALSGHTTAGTAGAALGNLVNALTESYAANGQPATLAQLLYEILAVLANVSQSGTSIVATKLDGATPAMSFTLDSATAPTTRRRVS